MSLHPATLKCLQVFIAIVEEGSFNKASGRLNLTQSAVSHRLKQLEEIAGIPLINRTTRYIKITDAGERLYNQSRLQLAEIERALSSLRSTADSPLSVTTISSLATKWLLPKLGHYNQKFPQQPLSVLTDDKITDLHYKGIDAAIRLTNVKDPSLHMTYICDEWVFPVASQSLLDNKPTSQEQNRLSFEQLINQPELLFNFPWLLDVVAEKGHDESSWHGWLKSQDLELPPNRTEQSFDRSDIALQAAAAGQGIAIARASLVQTDMLTMKLFQQVGRAVKMKYAYYFVCPHHKAEDPVIVNFRHWLVQELSQSVEQVRQQLVV